MNPETRPNPSDFEPSFRVRSYPTLAEIKAKVINWLTEQSSLFEAFFVAVTFHVLLFPLIWFMGWALPWPKSPTITTVIEINLENWPESASPEKIEEIYQREFTKTLPKQN